MATDEERPTEHPAGSGPRHAAPRKPLLARLHMPAGKAIALAAMPSAVLMGIGLTPTLAQAKPVAPANPFGEAGCVTAPDKAPTEPETPSASASAKPTPEPEPSGTAEPAPAASRSPGAAPRAGAKPAPAPSAKPDAEPAPVPPAASGTAPAPAPSPSSSPSAPSTAKNPLDPLGLGDVLGGILTGRKAAPAKPVPSTGPTAAPSAPSVPAPVAKPPASPSPSPSVTPSADAGAKAPATAKATPTPTPTPGATTPSPEASGTPSAGPDKPLPPCPPGTVVDANEHRAFPNQPWYLEASTLTLHGLTYEGIKQITMVNGEKKTVLKFTADSLDIKDLHQIVNNQGMQYHVAGIGTTSTVGGGRITMYTEELKGNLLGLIPSTQSPSSPPPLIPGVKLPIPIFFTNVKIRQSGQYGGTLHIPNLHQYLTPGTYP
ncbi:MULTISPECIES: hypothetical protein [Streptomyces]|uniref:Hydrogenase expression protein HypF n=1 Tax=Streptomyces luteosporeus TaxID=173856 RepID=A0ABN3U1X6_9ACTN